VRRRLEIAGRVQGVGFRPFLFRLASALCLDGVIGNDSKGAFAEVEGPDQLVERFVSRLSGEAPPLARVRRVDVQSQPPRGEAGLRIVAWDQRGHGDSEHAALYSWAADVCDARVVLDSTSSEPVHAVGHSKGGSILMALIGYAVGNYAGLLTAQLTFLAGTP